MAHIHLIIGPVGAGKSTLALELSQRHAALQLDLDDWMAVLFRPDRPEQGLLEWYRERVERCIEQIWHVTESALTAGTNVVLEIGLIQRSDRKRFYQRVDDAGYPLTVYVVDAPREVRRNRVTLRNKRQGATFSMVVPPDIFELASDMWQPPDGSEMQRYEMRFVGEAS